MRTNLIRLTAVCLFLGLTCGAFAQEDPKAIIEKAIKAYGGKENILKYKAAHTKTKGTLHIMGMDAPYSSEIYSQEPDKAKSTETLEIAGMTVQITSVVNGDKISISVGGNDFPLDDDKLKEIKEQTFGKGLFNKIVKGEKDLEIAAAGEAKVNEKAAVGIRVTPKGHRAVTLYFDKATGLLARSETRIVDINTGKEMTQEITLSKYKDVQGVQTPMKVEMKRDGEKFLEIDVVEIKLLEKLDAATFEKP